MPLWDTLCPTHSSFLWYANFSQNNIQICAKQRRQIFSQSSPVSCLIWFNTSCSLNLNFCGIWPIFRQTSPNPNRSITTTPDKYVRAMWIRVYVHKRLEIRASISLCQTPCCRHRLLLGAQFSQQLIVKRVSRQTHACVQQLCEIKAKYV